MSLPTISKALALPLAPDHALSHSLGTTLPPESHWAMATREELHSWLRALYEGDATDGKVALAICIYVSQPLIPTVSTILAMRCEDLRMPPMPEQGMQVILSRTPYWCPKNLDDKFLCPVLSFGVQLTHMMRAKGRDLYVGGMNDMADMAGAHMFSRTGDGHLPIMDALDFCKRLAAAIHRADERSRRFNAASFTVDGTLCLLEETRDLLLTASENKDPGGPSPSPSQPSQPPSSSAPRDDADASSSARAEPSGEASSSSSSSSVHAAHQPRDGSQSGEPPQPHQGTPGGPSGSGGPQQQQQQQQGPSGSTSRTCRRCGYASSLRCSLCGEAKYCSLACQKGDWGRHKAECRRAGKAPAKEGPEAARQQQQQQQPPEPQRDDSDVPQEPRDGLMTIVGPPLGKDEKPTGPSEA